MTASSMGCTPLFFRLEPHNTGTILPAMVALRSACFEFFYGDHFAFEETMSQIIIGFGNTFN